MLPGVMQQHSIRQGCDQVTLFGWSPRGSQGTSVCTRNLGVDLPMIARKNLITRVC
jgi:hypothetical protein